MFTIRALKNERRIITMSDEVKQVCIAVMVFILAIFAACAGKWEVVGTVITGYFAILNFSNKKGHQADEKSDPVPSNTSGV